jgi:lipid-binding SYLF domain-containing protein
MKRVIVLAAIFLISLLSLPQVTTGADNPGAARLQDCFQVLNKTISTQKNFLPTAIFQNASGLVIVPRFFKAGFLMGMRHGKGIMVVKDSSGKWSNPVFITISGGSVGLQAGIQSSEVVMVFRKSASMEAKKQGNFLFGADISFVLGILGIQMDENTDAGLKAEIYSYSKPVGINVGFALQGVSMRVDDSATAALYGKANIKDILSGKVDPVPAEVTRFKENLNALAARTP